MNPTQQPLWQKQLLILLPRSLLIHDDTIIIKVHGSRKQTKQTSSQTHSVPTNMCPARWSCGYRTEDWTSEEFGFVFVRVRLGWNLTTCYISLCTNVWMNSSCYVNNAYMMSISCNAVGLTHIWCFLTDASGRLLGITDEGHTGIWCYWVQLGEFPFLLTQWNWAASECILARVKRSVSCPGNFLLRLNSRGERSDEESRGPSTLFAVASLSC